MNTDDMTPTQLRELADEKEQEAVGKVTRTAITKTDLIWTTCEREAFYHFCENLPHIATRSDVEAAFKTYLQENVFIPKGAICVQYDDDDETWHDTENGEEVDHDLIISYLENINPPL